IMERSSRFSEVWQRVLWNRPDLDLSVKTPVSTIGNELRSEMRSAQLKVALSELKERYGLFFFYKSTCVFCVKYAPILRAFSDYHGINVVPVSLDAAILPEWPESKIDNGQFIGFGLTGKPVPATLLFDNKTKEIVELGFGLLTMSDLEERMSILINERER
ncbi:MAG: conjugal transfer protein TraF, partial [Alphaproteobacteria bacterium]